jgi:hypothetical protein
MGTVKMADLPDHARVDDVKRSALDRVTCGHCGLPAPGDQVRVTFSYNKTWGDVYTHPAEECFRPVVGKNPVQVPGGAASRPSLDDEVGRQRFWQNSLDKHGGDRNEVIRTASRALAMREAHIARLQEQLSEANPSRRGGT